MIGDFLNAINHAVKAKEVADESMKTRLMQYILILLVSVFTIISLYHYGLLKGVVAVIKWMSRSLFLVIIMFSISIYLIFSAVYLTLKLPSVHIIVIGTAIVLSSGFYAIRNFFIKEMRLIRFCMSIAFVLSLLLPIFFLGINISCFAAIMKVYHSHELFFDVAMITPIQLYMSIPLQIFFLR